MKRYDGIFTIKWHKNDNGDVRPFTIECENREELKAEFNRIEKAFREKGDDPTCSLYKEWHKEVYSIKFEVLETR